MAERGAMPDQHRAILDRDTTEQTRAYGKTADARRILLWTRVVRSLGQVKTPAHN